MYIYGIPYHVTTDMRMGGDRGIGIEGIDIPVAANGLTTEVVKRQCLIPATHSQDIKGFLY